MSKTTKYLLLSAAAIYLLLPDESEQIPAKIDGDPVVSKEPDVGPKLEPVSVAVKTIPGMTPGVTLQAPPNEPAGMPGVYGAFSSGSVASGGLSGATVTRRYV